MCRIPIGGGAEDELCYRRNSQLSGGSGLYGQVASCGRATAINFPVEFHKRAVWQAIVCFLAYYVS